MKTKERVLTLLESQRGQYVSGEALAEQLGLSRGAVWKGITALKSDGYTIDASTKKGYCLSAHDDTLSPSGIALFLDSHNQPHPKKIDVRVFDTLPSTNTTAKAIALTTPPDTVTVVIANAQTTGKGRYGRVFHSPPGTGLYMSFILPNFWGAQPTLITASAAVAVCEAIEALCENKKPAIKWVNDIFLGGKKICGISTEAVMDLESGTIQWIVLGIGINVRFGEGDVPAALQDVIGALFDFNGSNGSNENPPLTRNRLAAEVINRVTTLPTYGSSVVLERYRQRLFVLGRTVQVMAEIPYEAVAVDLDDEGRLIVQKPTGEVVVLSFGEISVRV